MEEPKAWSIFVFQQHIITDDAFLSAREFVLVHFCFSTTHLIKDDAFLSSGEPKAWSIFVFQQHVIKDYAFQLESLRLGSLLFFNSK
jgi:hypothetical protein